MGLLRYVRPDKRVKSGSVSGGADTDFVDDWLIDTRPSFPAKKTGATVWTVTPDVVRNVDTFAIANHFITAGSTVTFSIGSAVITVQTWGEDGIPFNDGVVLAAPVSTGASFTVTVTNPLIGDLWVGLSDTISQLLSMRELDPGEAFEWESALAPNTDGYSEIRRYAGDMILTNSEWTAFKAWRRSTKKGSEPTLIYMNVGEIDEWLLARFNYTARRGEGRHFVSIEIAEIPRTEW